MVFNVSRPEAAAQALRLSFWVAVDSHRAGSHPFQCGSRSIATAQACSRCYSVATNSRRAGSVLERKDSRGLEAAAQALILFNVGRGQ